MMREVFAFSLVGLRASLAELLTCRREVKVVCRLSDTVAACGRHGVIVDGEGRGCEVGPLQRGGQHRLTFRGVKFTIPEVVVPHLSFSPKPLAGGAAGSCQSPGSQSDERLVALIRGGQRGAFDVLAARYEARLLWLCRRMLGSAEDAQDALQDVLVSAVNAILADEHEIRDWPWLHRIARNRCLDKPGRPTSVRAGSIDDFCAENDRGLVETVGARQQLVDLVSDVPASSARQSTALLLREVDGLGYREVALATRTTVPGVTSLLVRARTGLVDSAATRETPPALSSPKTTPGRSRTRTRKNARAVSYPTARAAANAFA